MEEIASYTTRLFQAMKMVQEVSPTDLFIAAGRSKQIDDDDQREADIASVANEFPKLASEDKTWLCRRLGRAITHRRQFLLNVLQNGSNQQSGTLRNAHQRHDESREQGSPSIPPLHDSGGPTTHATNQSPETPISSRMPNLFKLQVAYQVRREPFRPFPQGNIPTDSGTSSVHADRAMHSQETDTARGRQILRSNNIDPDTWAQDQILQLSKASLMERTRVFAYYRIYEKHMHQQARLEKEVECPFCCEVYRIENEREWHRHVYKDFRAYVCTFPECNMSYFDDVDEWFNHEMKNHRICFQCPICQEDVYDAEQQYLDHMRSSHRAVLESGDTQAILEIGKRPIESISVAECPFCTTWPANAAQTITYAGAPSRVSPVDFKRHLASHLEEVALLSLPIPGSDGRMPASVLRSQAVHEEEIEPSAPPNRDSDTMVTTSDRPKRLSSMIDESWRPAAPEYESTKDWLERQQYELSAQTVHMGDENDTGSDVNSDRKNVKKSDASQ